IVSTWITVVLFLLVLLAVLAVSGGLLVHFRHHFMSASQDSLTATVGVYKWVQSVVLPCQYREELEELVTVKWSRLDLNPNIVHLRREGDDELAQNQVFRGRTSLILEAQDSGDFSLTLREPQPSDSGNYVCSIINDKEEILSD
ncbi:hypothetical protein GOODEAATRI_026443, partial [Goodea atripinnis]